MRCLLLLLVSLLLTAAEDTLTKHGVTVVVRQVPGAVEATFTPEAHHHVYATSLPPGAAGVATALTLDPTAGVAATGPVTADRQTLLLQGLPVFPDGPVTLRLPIAVTDQPVPVRVSYLACTADSCRIPVMKARLVAPAIAPASAPAIAAAAGTWATPRTVAEVEALIAGAGGRPVLLDFTGPSCINCQVMEKTVFRTPEAQGAFAGLVLVKVDTDPPHDDLAAWQQARFQSQNRPLYVRLEGDRETRWNVVFPPSDRGRLTAFTTFLGGGPGADAAAESAGLGGFIALALLGGLITLLMPCTYPMVPFTLTFFAKQAAQGRRLLPLALAYGAGIMACFIGLGLAITAVFGSQISSLAGHPLTNLVIAVIFVAFGLSLLGLWFLHLPGLSGRARTGYLGALLMGLTFAVTAFTCTAPFAGAVLSAGVATGAWGAAAGGMAIYSGAIAVPFVLLALAPGWLSRLPRAGAWMEELKIIGGLVELAAALKFLVICDVAWDWGLVTRLPVLAAWSATALLCAVIVVGFIRPPGQERLEGVAGGRLILALVFGTLAVVLGAGAAGADLGFVEGFFPDPRN